MEYKTTYDKDTIKIEISGKLDTVTTPVLEKYLEENIFELNNINTLILDFKNLDYISSAGLRLLLRIQKQITVENKNFEIHNVNEFVMEVLEITGFKDILKIK